VAFLHIFHIAINLWAFIASLRWGDWKNINTYYTTILYMIIGNLIYFYLYGEDTLWNFLPDRSDKFDTLREMLYMFVAFPCSILIYLSNFPAKSIGKVLHIIKWIVIYSGLEWVGSHFGFVDYDSGWNQWWSVGFNCIMFPMLFLHLKKPYIALLISVLIVIVLTSIFSPEWHNTH
jgi:hypothetical protein